MSMIKIMMYVRITQKNDNHSTIAAKCLQEDSFVRNSDLCTSKFSSAAAPSPAILDSSSFRIKKRPALLLKTNIVVDEIQLGVSMLMSCSLRNRAVKINAKVANAKDSR